MDARLRQVFVDVFNLPADKVTDTTLAKDVETWDSLKHLQLVVALEQTFNIQMETDEIQEIKGVADVIALLNSRNVL